MLGSKLSERNYCFWTMRGESYIVPLVVADMTAESLNLTSQKSLHRCKKLAKNQ